MGCQTTIEWLRFSLFDLYKFQIFDFSSDPPEVVAKLKFNPKGLFFHIGDFHGMKKVEFHILTNLTFFLFEWGIRKFSDSI